MPAKIADVLTKDEGAASDLWRSTVRASATTLASEDLVPMRREGAKERRQDAALKRPSKNRKSKACKTNASESIKAMCGAYANCFDFDEDECFLYVV